MTDSNNLPMSAALVAEAARLMERGDLAALEALCQKGKAAFPDESEFDHILGVALCATPRRAEGLDCLRRALAARPDDPVLRHNLAITLGPEDALESEQLLCENVQRFPAFAHSWYSLGLLCMRRAEAGDPQQWQLAEVALAKATDCMPENAEAWNNRGIVLAKLGRLEESVAAYQHALTQKPDHPEALHNLAGHQTTLGKHDAALPLWQRYLALRPEHASAWHGLATALHHCGAWEAADEAYRRGLALEPGNVEAIRGRALTLKYLGQITAAVQLLFEALQLSPAHAANMNSLGAILMDMGMHEDAMRVLRRGLALEPDRAETRSNLMFSMQYSDTVTAAEIAQGLAECEQWFGAGKRVAPPPQRHAGRERLRIGYVSADFRLHSCAYFIEPTLIGHDRSAFEIYCYSNVKSPDATTERLRSLADQWRDINARSDAEVFDLIRADGIDILIDLGGHTSKNRLGLFAMRPVAVQLSWLGYPDDTGLKAIDARISDAQIDPPEQQAQPGQVLRLEGGMHCYSPAIVGQVPEVGPLPAHTNGYITFGSFNNIAKLSPTCLKMWAQLLAAVPQSRLVLKHWQLSDGAVRNDILRRFFVEGVDLDRIILLERTPDQQGHLAAYNRIDIALDTFPYHGTTTTCEAMWMGVPVLSLAGERPAARVGVSMLTRLGLLDYLAESPADFVARGQAIAADLEALAQLRAQLRQRIQASPLGDPTQWTPHLEAAYRAAWAAADGR